MKTSRRTKTALALLAGIVLAAGLLTARTAQAGELEPPGPPGPTMVTLQQIDNAIGMLDHRSMMIEHEVYSNTERVMDLQQQVADLKLQLGVLGMAETVGGMVLIPAGPFRMGDAFAEGETRERPVHTVTVSAFYMAQYPVTKALWDEVRGWAITNGYTDLPEGGGKGPSHPVHTVDWHDCVKWANARSESEGLTPVYGQMIPGPPPSFIPTWTVYRSGTDEHFAIVFGDGNGYRLPTEAEWEKAARGGVEGRRFPWSDGNTIAHTRANYNANPSTYDYDVSATSDYHPDYDDGVSPRTSPVGSFPPNGYGLYDMSGNVWEWCWDWYSSTYYPISPTTDPRGPGSGPYRMFRGGGWFSIPDYCRVAYRPNFMPSNATTGLGFRLVRAAH